MLGASTLRTGFALQGSTPLTQLLGPGISPPASIARSGGDVEGRAIMCLPVSAVETV